MRKTIVIAVSVVAALLGSTTSAQADSTAPTCGTGGGYTSMQDYVDTLVYWHRNPTWYPAG
jgi:hypothetical protein